jgi:hypothetical protein
VHEARPKFREETPLETYGRTAADSAIHAALQNMIAAEAFGKGKMHVLQIHVVSGGL